MQKILIALVIAIGLVAPAFAAEEAAPSVLGAAVKKAIPSIRSVAQFKGRQSVRLPWAKFEPAKSPTIPDVGGQNVAAARQAILEALAKVKKEIDDQATLQKNLAGVLQSLKAHIIALNGQIKDLQAAMKQFDAELATLKAIPNPSQAILDCIKELEADKKQAHAKIGILLALRDAQQAKYDHLLKYKGSMMANRAALEAARKNLNEALLNVSKIVLPKK